MRMLFPGVLTPSCISKCEWFFFPELNVNTCNITACMLCFSAILAGKSCFTACKQSVIVSDVRIVEVLGSSVTLGHGRPLSVLLLWAQPRALMRVSVWEAGLPRSWPINSFEVFAVRVLLLWLQGLRVLQEVFVPLILRFDVGADGGGALTLKATGQSCRSQAEKNTLHKITCSSHYIWTQYP